MVSHFYRLAGLLAWAALSAPALAAEPAGLSALRIAGEATPAMDGALDDAVWQRAPRFEAFHKHEPRDGKFDPSATRTTVQVLVDEHALVFGIRAWDADPSRLRGSLARRDKVDMDQDFIGIWIDPVGHGRAAQFVRINTAGVISDGVHRADDDESDLGPDFPLDAAVKLLPDGYSMEVRWPLASLRFPYSGGRNWRLLVERSIPHADGTMLVSAPLKTDVLSHLSFLQEIDGMGSTVESVRDRRFIELRPELTMRTERRALAGRRDRGGQIETGMEVNVRPRADWVFNAMWNPDYSQIEVDQPVSTGASNIALSLPEKRAFFLESSDVLGLGLPAFYSRTVFDPQWGARATWRAADADATAMSLSDQPGGLVLRGRPYETLEFPQLRASRASLGRARWHGDGMLVGGFVSQRDYGRFGRNDVAGADFQWRGTTEGGAQRQWSAVAMHSQNSADFDPSMALVRSPVRQGNYLSTRFVHSSEQWLNEFELEAISPGFVNDNGFVPQTGIVRAELEINRILGSKQLGPLELYEFEAYLGAEEVRTLRDRVSGQEGNEVVLRALRPGIWFAAPYQTRLWTELGFDRSPAAGPEAGSGSPGIAPRPCRW